MGDFAVLSRACHLPTKKGVAVGIDRKRLVCAAAKLLSQRQKHGIKNLFGKSRDILSAGQGTVHAAYTHCWDEVNARFKQTKPHKKYRGVRATTHKQTIVQRGALSSTVYDETHKTSKRHVERWLVKPKTVESTSAEALLPAILAGMPV